jgi:phosphopantothenoylcysteine decarboxylase/phosphopantothenate--cysteine ligase
MEAVLEELDKASYDVFISAAAPSDFAPVFPAHRKIPTEKGTMTLTLKPTPKIIGEVRRRIPKIYLVAFKAETSGSAKELRSAIKKFKDKAGANMVVGNDVSGGRGFGTDTNSVVILGRSRTTSGELPKDKIARILLDEVAADRLPNKSEGSRRQQKSSARS